MATGRRRLSPEFKQKAFLQLIEGERASKVAPSLGIPVEVLLRSCRSRQVDGTLL